jgi:hypothetical protein
VKKNKQLSSGLAAAVAVAALLGTSAFADSRHADETSWRDGGRRDRAESRGRGNETRNDRDWNRDGDRNRGNDRDRDHDRDRNDSYRNDRSDRNDRQPYFANGRVSRVDRDRDGYRVWVGGARYPFYVPSRYYNRDRFRIGVSIQLGGYYNPAGYYDYYDGRSGRGYDRADLRGVVESVDYRRDAFVVRDGRRYITVFSTDNLRRRELRRGDVVDVYGSWARNGVFRAYDVDVVGY